MKISSLLQQGLRLGTQNMRKHPVTLLEILLVIALVGLTFGVIATQLPKALRGEKFERGVDQMKSRIELAQEVMLDYQTDLKLFFESTQKGMVCVIDSERPLPGRVKKAFLRPIEGIEEISSDVLEFDGKLGTPPKGKLILKGNNREAILRLKGFPSALVRGGENVPDSEADYPEAVLSFI